MQKSEARRRDGVRAAADGKTDGWVNKGYALHDAPEVDKLSRIPLDGEYGRLSFMTVPAATAPARPYFERIDVLRALAILLVFFHHYYEGLYSVPEKAELFIEHWPQWLRPWHTPILFLPKAGYFGVQLFFVISGFCIHGSYLSWRRKNADAPLTSFVPTFFWKRFWRIVPPFLVTLVFSYAVTSHGHWFEFASLRKLALNATLLKTLFPGHFYSINPAHWSVDVEWQLYLVYPLVLFLLLRAGLYPAILATWIVTLVLDSLVPHWTSSTFILNLPFAWWFEWTLGVLIAEKRARGESVFRGHAWLASIFSGLLVYSFLTHWGPGNYLFPRVLFAVLVEWVLIMRRPLARWERVLVPIGLCSYSIYLLHIPLMLVYWHVLRASGVDFLNFGTWLATGLLLLAATIPLSWWSYRRLELGSVRLGEALWPRAQSLRLRRAKTALEPVERVVG